MQSLDSVVARRVLNDVPGLLFFSTYTLLVLFWAEIYQQVRLRPMWCPAPSAPAPRYVLVSSQAHAPRRRRAIVSLFHCSMHAQ